MEILELKFNKNLNFKNSLEGLNRRFEQAEERTGIFEDS